MKALLNNISCFNKIETIISENKGVLCFGLKTLKLYLLIFFGIVNINIVLAQPTSGTRQIKTIAPGASYTFAHTQDAGSGRLLVVMTATTQNGVYPSAVTYNGVALTRNSQWTSGGGGADFQIWSLVNPAAGANNIVVTYSGNQTQTSAICAYSFTNSSGVGTTGINESGGYNTERTVALTVEANSLIIGTGWTTITTAPTSVKIPSPTAIALIGDGDIGGSRRFFYSISGTLSAGSRTMAAIHSSSHVYPVAIEIKAVACTSASISSPPSTSTASTCLNGTAFTALSVTAAGSATLSYQWQSSAQSNFSSGVLNVGTNSASYTPVNTAAGTLYYRCVVTSSCNSSTATSNASGAFTVSAASVGGTASAASATICSGSSTTVSVSGHTGTIQWQQSSDGSTGWGNVSGGSGSTTSTYTTPNLTSTTYYRAVITNGTCTAANSTTATVTVRSAFTSGEISSTGQTICSGGTPSAIGSTTAASGGDASITYSWRSSADSYVAAISLATSSTYTPPAGLTATTSYRRYAKDNTCNTTPTVSTGTWAVTVSAVSVGGTIAGGATVCTGTNSTVLTLSGHTGSITRWESSLDNFATAGTSIANTTTTLTATNLAATTYYRAVVTSGSCAAANSATGTVTVSPVSVGGSIAGGATVCTGTNSTVLTLSGHTGSITRWESSLDNFATAGTSVANTTTTLTATNLTATTYYRAVVTSGSCAAANSATATVTVTSAPSAGTLSGTQSICVGGSSTFSSTVAGGSWSSDNTGIATINASTGAISGVAAGTATMTYTVTGTGGCSNATATRNGNRSHIGRNIKWYARDMRCRFKYF